MTFVAASGFLENRGDPAGDYLTVALVAMESPAIIMAVLLGTWVRGPQHQPAAAGVSGPGEAHTETIPSLKEVVHEAFADGAHLLLIGSLVIGAVPRPAGGHTMAPFVGDIFTGLLTLFLLEMGLLVARQLREAQDVGPFLITFGLVAPVVNAAAALGLGAAL